MTDNQPDMSDEIYVCEGCGTPTKTEHWTQDKYLSCCPERKPIKHKIGRSDFCAAVSDAPTDKERAEALKNTLRSSIGGGCAGDNSTIGGATGGPGIQRGAGMRLCLNCNFMTDYYDLKCQHCKSNDQRTSIRFKDPKNQALVDNAERIIHETFLRQLSDKDIETPKKFFEEWVKDHNQAEIKWIGHSYANAYMAAQWEGFLAAWRLLVGQILELGGKNGGSN